MLTIEIDTSLPSGRVVRVLNTIAAWCSYPKRLRTANGPELVSQQLKNWAENRGDHLDFIEPDKPAQNASTERFNRTYRKDLLDFYLFSNMAEVKEITGQWLEEYNAICLTTRSAARCHTNVHLLPLKSRRVSTLEWSQRMGSLHCY